MSSVSGLGPEHRTTARARAVAAATLALSHKAVVHYTQGLLRWQGIAARLIAANGEFPRYADCSAFVTWCLWNGLAVPFGVRDVVNGDHWQSGYTGTLLSHGKRVRHPENMMRGDAVLYGRPGTTGEHTALVVGGGKVISHGSEAGPFLLPWNYRRDVMEVRRYI